MTINQLNTLPDAEIQEVLFSCCGSSDWVQAMMNFRPFSSEAHLYESAQNCWLPRNEADFLEAFSHHPKIGDVDSLRSKFASTAHFAAGEQRAVSQAPEEVLKCLARGNADYEKKFGFIFIVCATGKSAAEMLRILQKRLPNSRGEEIRIAAAEQAKITRIRLEKLFA